MEEIVISSQATDAGESAAEAGVERARVSDPSPVTRACSAFEAFRRGGSNYFGRVAQTLPAAFAPPDADAADAAARASEAARRARVALRRARVLLALYRGAAAPGAFEEIDAGAKAVSRALGAARDADLLALDVLPRLIAEAPAQADRAALEAARAVAEKRRLAARRRATGPAAERAALTWLVSAQSRMLAFMAETEAAPGALLARRPRLARTPVARFAAARLEKRFARLARQATALEAATVEERHAFRRAVKRFRYAADVFEPLYERARFQPFRRAMKKVNRALGGFNDAAVAAEAMAELPAKRHARAIALTSAWAEAEMERAWAETRARWRELSAEKPFW